MPKVEFILEGADEALTERDITIIPRAGEWVFLADGGGHRTVRHLEHDVLLDRVIVHLRKSDADRQREAEA